MKLSDADFQLLRQSFQARSLEERQEYLQNLTPVEQEFFYKHPELFLFDKQVPPPGPWRYHLFRGGRGIGKTFASTSWLASKILNGAKEVAIVGPSHDDLEKEIIPTFLSHFTPEQLKKFKTKMKSGMITTHTGCIVKLYSSQYEIRGCNPEYAVAEEICKWCDCIPEKIQERWSVFNLAVRNKRANPPQIFIASTPKPFKWFIDFENKVKSGDPRYSMHVGSTFDNPFLSDDAKEAFLEQYGTTRLGSQELYGNLLLDVPGALFDKQWIDRARLTHDQFYQKIDNNVIGLKRIIIGLDPAVTNGDNSDETGVIVVAVDYSGELYVLEDKTNRYTPHGWARLVRDLFRKYSQIAPTIIAAEVNQGGDLVVSNLLAADASLKTAIRTIHASKGKLLRAETVAAKYERGKVHHVGEFATLETQMITYTGNPNQKSPDHLDALVHSINQFILTPAAPKRDLSALGNGW